MCAGAAQPALASALAAAAAATTTIAKQGSQSAILCGVIKFYTNTKNEIKIFLLQWLFSLSLSLSRCMCVEQLCAPTIVGRARERASMLEEDRQKQGPFQSLFLAWGGPFAIAFGCFGRFSSSSYLCHTYRLLRKRDPQVFLGVVPQVFSFSFFVEYFAAIHKISMPSHKFN